MNYAVQPGDTLYGIARKHNLSTDDLISLNNWSSVPTLQIGQEIIVGKSSTPQNNTKVEPATSGKTHTVVKGDSLYAIGRKYNISPARILTENNLGTNAGIYIGQVLKIPSEEQEKTTTVTPTPNTSGQQKIHKVDAGESLYGIARQYQTTPQAILAANGLPANTPIYIGQELNIPSGSTNAPTSTVSTPKQSSTVPKQQPPKVYTVQQGDTLYKISREVGLTPQKILELNGFDANTPIQIGQELKVTEETSSPGSTSSHSTTTVTPQKETPKPSKTSHKISRGESLYAIGKKYNVSPAEILAYNKLTLDATIYIGQILHIPPQSQKPSAPNPTSSPKAPENPRYHVYTIQSGDYLSKIAKKFGVTPQEIVAANHIPKGRIYVGQQIMIPKQSGATSAPSQQQNTSSNIHNAQGRSIYQLSKLDGKTIFANGLRNKIGSRYNMIVDDVENLQKRLIQLGLLSSSHGENVRQIAQSYSGQVPGSRVPNTLSALRKMQDRFRLNWWVGTDARCQMLGTNQFTYGEVSPHDATYKFLKDFTKFTLKFPNPVNGQTETAEFQNFVYSGYNQYYDGVGYIGKSLPKDIPLSVYTDVGLSPVMASAMQVVSSHEGNFDAINSYDKAFFSYGFIQFAGGGRGLAPLIARMKVTQPALFKSIFQSVGIDVEYTTRNNDIHQGELIIDFPGKGRLKGIEAEKALRGDHQLYGPFIRAAFHPELIKAQILQGVKAYAKPALGIKLNINTGRFSQSNLLITEVINSAMGLGFAIDMTVNKWIVKTGEMFSNAINAIARQKGLHSLQQIMMIDEREVLQEIVRQEGGADKRVADRGNSMLHSGLSSAKNPTKGQGLIA
ncbi:LysM peptidoglycan-binding domain-containing protein [Flammeovirga agarivorans]|uniref:LysM peptidoglycan-binding domain-containing protein n=1 Tax=Flammeovirga agarivorans TaxID=2726742 RepID=A0A7X8SIC5_9BACT|nr:LysM peptidoglycan-binding domain-containing protein [Flammeovirga agarivorans]NLR90760.1 LysM peptidoglycan-binding domain-containing protein [Flammeovirga agarivorans]